MKIRPVGAELFHTDGRADMTKLIVAFRNFTKPPNNSECVNNVLCKLHTSYLNASTSLWLQDDVSDSDSA